MSIAIVLSGGGSQGDFEVGALRYLYAQGIRPDVVCGTSVGAINATALAIGEGGLDILEGIWLSLRNNDEMYAEEPWFQALDPLIKGLIKQDGSMDATGELQRDLYLGLAGYVLSSPLMRIVEAAIAANVVSDKLIPQLQAVLNARSIYNLDPIYKRMQTILLEFWLTLNPARRKNLHAATDSFHRIVLFARGVDGSFGSISQTQDRSAWDSWIAMGGSFSSNVAAHRTNNGVLEAFGLGLNGSLWRSTQTPGKPWTSWQPFSPGWQFVSDPAMGTTDGGLLEICALGTDGVLYRREQITADTWSDAWNPHPGPVRFIGDPAVAQNADGQPEIFVNGADFQIYRCGRLDQVWGGWESLGAPGGLASSNVAVGSNSDGSLTVFVRGADRALWYKYQGAAGAWGQATWNSLGGGITSDPAVASDAGGRLVVFARGMDNSLYRSSQLNPRSAQNPVVPWSPWLAVGGNFTGDPIAMTDADLKLHLFARAWGDGDVRHRIWDIAGQPGNWESLGGNVWTGIQLRLASVSLNSGNLRYADETGTFIDNFAEVVDLVDAVLASAAIPAIFAAPTLLNQIYVDGGIREVLPIRSAIEAGATQVYAVAASKNATDFSHVDNNMLGIAKRAAMELMPNEIMRKDTDLRGWNVPIRIIQPTVDVHDSLKIEPGLIRIAMAYGFMRANDVLGVFEQGVGPTIRQLSDQITALRTVIWAEEEAANKDLTDYLVLLHKAPPLPDNTLPDRVKANMLKLRADKQALKGLVEERSQLGGAFPSVNMADWWNKWEGHAALGGSPPYPWVLPASPWEAVPDAGVGQAVPVGIGGYNLNSASDRVFAFDYDSSGELNHLVLYRPGTGAIFILRNNVGTFTPVYQQGDPGSGIGGYNLNSASDRVFAFDYDSSGKLDHLVLCRPGTGAIFILKNNAGTFTPVYQQGDPGSGIGGYDLSSASDQVFAFDYDSSGKLDHLVLCRPGTGAIFILKNNAGIFTPIYQQGDPGSGIGGYNLSSASDQVFAFDYDSSGKLDHLVLYRPGKGAIFILKNNAGIFTPVYQQADPGSGIGGYDLRSAYDRASSLGYDHTGNLDHLVLYRPGQGTIWILKNSAGNFTPVYTQDYI